MVLARRSSSLSVVKGTQPGARERAHPYPRGSPWYGRYRAGPSDADRSQRARLSDADRSQRNLRRCRESTETTAGFHLHVARPFQARVRGAEAPRYVAVKTALTRRRAKRVAVTRDGRKRRVELKAEQRMCLEVVCPTRAVYGHVIGTIGAIIIVVVVV